MLSPGFRTFVSSKKSLFALLDTNTCFVGSLIGSLWLSDDCGLTRASLFLRYCNILEGQWQLPCKFSVWLWKVFLQDETRELRALLQASPRQDAYRGCASLLHFVELLWSFVFYSTALTQSSAYLRSQDSAVSRSRDELSSSLEDICIA